jgi:hypothetical protein
MLGEASEDSFLFNLNKLHLQKEFLIELVDFLVGDGPIDLLANVGSEKLI